MGTGSSDVHAVGEQEHLLRFNGSAWTSLTSPPGPSYLDVWGTDPTHAIAVTHLGTIFRFGGSAWQLEASPTSSQLGGVSGTSTTDIFAVGVGGTIVRFDGTSWATQNSGTTTNLTKVWAGSSVYVASSGILRGYRGATVALTPANPTLTAIGATQQLTATPRDAQNNVISGVAFTWTSGNAGVATVGASTGLVTAAGVGTATITATAPGGASGSATVTVISLASVSAGFNHACAVTTAGAGYCWGSNSIGQLGRGGALTRDTVPVSVAGALTFTSISAGGIYTCGVASGGSAYCWGDNNRGKLGDGTSSFRTTPVAVLGGQVFQSVSAGGQHTCGVTTALFAQRSKPRASTR